jgi:hypothetical protein
MVFGSEKLEVALRALGGQEESEANDRHGRIVNPPQVLLVGLWRVIYDLGTKLLTKDDRPISIPL